MNLEQFLKGSLSSAMVNNGVNANYSTNLTGNVFTVTLTPLDHARPLAENVAEILKKSILMHAQTSNITLPQNLQINIQSQTKQVGTMDRKAALKRLKKIAQESHAILNALAQDAAPQSGQQGGPSQVNRAGLEAAVKARVEALMPGSGFDIKNLSLGDLDSQRPTVFLTFRASQTSNNLKAAVTQAAKQVLNKDVTLQAISEF